MTIEAQEPQEQSHRLRNIAVIGLLVLVLTGIILRPHDSDISKSLIKSQNPNAALSTSIELQPDQIIDLSGWQCAKANDPNKPGFTETLPTTIGIPGVLVEAGDPTIMETVGPFVVVIDDVQGSVPDLASIPELKNGDQICVIQGLGRAPTASPIISRAYMNLPLAV